MRCDVWALRAHKPILLLLAGAIALAPVPAAPAGSQPRDADQHGGRASTRDTYRPPDWSAGPVARGTGYQRAGASERVREMQRRLERLTYTPGPIDGLFGPRTEEAVRQFQRDQGLKLDGVVGPQTLGKLRAHTSQPRPANLDRLPPDWSAGPVARGTGYQRAGASERVREVQRRLERLTYTPGPIDGLFGPRTDEAVRQFQRDQGLKLDGVVGPQTLVQLRAQQEPGRAREPRVAARGAEEERGSKKYRPLPSGVVAVVLALGLLFAFAAGLTFGERRAAKKRTAFRPTPGMRLPATGQHLQPYRLAAATQTLVRTIERGIALPRFRWPQSLRWTWLKLRKPRKKLRKLRERAAPPPGHYGLRFKLLVVALAGLSTAGLYLLQGALWGQGRHAGGLEQIAQLLQFVWVLPIITGAVSVFGMLIQRDPQKAAAAERPLSTLVSFRFVSRGTNVETLQASIASVHEEMAKLPLFPYVVEVVTEETGIELAPGNIHYVIPNDYVTPKGTLYKARALQYGLEQSNLPDDAWILHCDEESHLHESLIRGICMAIKEEEASGEYRIGQGCILYYNSLEDHPFLTLADSIRTGDDVGRFHFQNRLLGWPVWGFHGSFILVRNDVEKEVGFDFGVNGSITEDAFWALREMEKGRRSRWVDGYMIEQAPEKLTDFIRQRRRWFLGLMKVVRYAPVPFRIRAPLALFTCLWSVGWVAIVYTCVNLFTGYYTYPVVQAIGNVAFACFITIYIVGLRTNLQLHPVSKPRAIMLYLMQALCVPIFASMEGAGVLYGILKRDYSFHVIQKTH